MPKVRLYTTPVCPYCIALKNFLKEHDVDFEEIDVSANDQAREELITKTNQFNVPVIEIDGELIIGFDKEKISQLLNINK